MKLLLISPVGEAAYNGVLLRNVERALASIGVGWDVADPNQPFEDAGGYDLYVGVGDELFRKKPNLVRRIRAIGGATADFRTRYLPRKPVRWLKQIVGLGTEQPDYVFTHFRSWHPRGLYVGQAVSDDLLYPEHDDIFTVYVDHFMGRSRHPCVQHILDQCAELHGSRSNVRVWYHTSHGIEENRFVEERKAPAQIPFETLAAYYRKAHVFLPTHRETQGMVAAEIGMCGGITLLRPWMYPLQRARQIPHRFYWSRISWPQAIDVAAHRAKAKAEFGIGSFAGRLKAALAIAARPAT